MLMLKRLNRKSAGRHDGSVFRQNGRALAMMRCVAAAIIRGGQSTFFGSSLPSMSGSGVKRWLRQIVIVSVAATGLPGCSKQTGGQVAAVVNNEEVTIQDIRAEASAEGFPADSDFQTIAPIVLQRVIERKLFAEYGRNQGLDRTSEFIARRQASEETILSALSARDLVGHLSPVSDAQIKAFIAGNPTLFAQRQKVQLDQIRFPAPLHREHIKDLDALGTIDKVEAQLKAEGVRTVRANAGLDTGTLEPAVAKQIVGLPSGQIFDVTIGDSSVISVIIEHQPVAPNLNEWRVLAKNYIEAKLFENAAGEKLAKIKNSSRIEIDPLYKMQGKSAN